MTFHRTATGVLGLCLLGGLMAQVRPAMAANETALASHRAVYDLKLRSARGQRAVQSVRGRIVYDFAGTRCEGYTLQFRQVTELDSGEGRTVVSDLRSSTWEAETGAQFRYMFENFMNGKTVSAVDGSAERDGTQVVARLKKPAERRIELGDVTFPTDHMRKVLRAAEEGRKVLEVNVYDGSDTGGTIYNTLAVIGQKIAPGEKPPQDAAAGKAELAGLARWPVSVSYFDSAKKTSGEQTPVYAITFELYANGISRALVLDYGDFSIAGEMTALDIGTPKNCP